MQHYKSLRLAVMLCATRARLSIVPVVPWEAAPASGGPRSTAKFLSRRVYVWTCSVGRLNVTTTTKKGRQLFDRRKVHPRENPGYVYEDRAPALRCYGGPEWLIRPDLCATLVNTQTHMCRHTDKADFDQFYYCNWKYMW